MTVCESWQGGGGEKSISLTGLSCPRNAYMAVHGGRLRLPRYPFPLGALYMCPGHKNWILQHFHVWLSCTFCHNQPAGTCMWEKTKQE
jgi:hypothetical protein